MKPPNVTLADIKWLCAMASENTGWMAIQGAEEDQKRINRIKRELTKVVRATVYGQPS